MNVQSALHICTRKSLVWPAIWDICNPCGRQTGTWLWRRMTSALVTFREQKTYVCCNAMVINLTVITLLTAWGSPNDCNCNSQSLALTCTTLGSLSNNKGESAKKTSLKKCIRVASNFTTLIRSCLIRQMWANFFGVEFWRALSKFRKRKRKLLSWVPVHDKVWN